MDFIFKPIGIIHSCFSDKFGVPRQPGLIPYSHGELELFSPYDREEAFTGLEDFSHIWVSFVFHHCLNQEERLTVRPPRLGGNKKLGVFATRATHRPNPIGMSVVALDEVRCQDGKVRLLLSGLDLVDGTPVLDVKPYVPYADSIKSAQGGYASEAPQQGMEVSFTLAADRTCQKIEQSRADFRALITSVLGFDPRPAYRKRDEPEKEYVVRLYGIDIRWRVVRSDRIEVFHIDSPV
ncbi:tRNA (N6-threonylcarbamoyladenosine(37)-N6)-methyltransferase TrmO [Pseudomonadota bacterium]